MLARLLSLVAFLITLSACSPTPSVEQKMAITSTDTTNTVVNQNIFKDDFGSKKKLYQEVFAPILDSTFYKTPQLFLQQLSTTYGQAYSKETSVLTFERQQILGLKDSIWFINCLSPTANNCTYPMQQTQYLFDLKGHLLHQSQAAVASFIPAVLDSMPIFMTITHNCEGNGQHHFYIYQQGKLIDIFNVLMENTPKSYDTNPEGGGVFRKNHLETFVEDVNQDGFNDIVLRGKWLVLDNGKGRQYPVSRPFKAERVEYQFLYHPTKEVFLLTE